MASVECCLWFPQVGGPHDKVRIAGIDSAEWEALAAWAQESNLPALVGLLGSDLPAGLGRSQLLRLASECARVDWDTLDGPALGGFAAFSLFVDTAAQQEGAERGSLWKDS